MGLLTKCKMPSSLLVMKTTGTVSVGTHGTYFVVGSRQATLLFDHKELIPSLDNLTVSGDNDNGLETITLDRGVSI